MLQVQSPKCPQAWTLFFRTSFRNITSGMRIYDPDESALSLQPGNPERALLASRAGGCWWRHDRAEHGQECFALCRIKMSDYSTWSRKQPPVRGDKPKRSVKLDMLFLVTPRQRLATLLSGVIPVWVKHSIQHAALSSCCPPGNLKPPKKSKVFSTPQ